MTPARILATVAAIGVALVQSDDAGACSCRGPQDYIVQPQLVSAPLNARIRTEMASTGRTAIVRVHGGADVATTAKTWPDGNLTYTELTPTQPLLPNTLYEIAVVTPGEFPSTRVLGAVKTGAAADTTAPKLVSTGTAAGWLTLHGGGGMCTVAGPKITIGPLEASDPSRPDAQFVYAIWLADAAGKLDTKRAPNGLLAPDDDDKIHLGKGSLCDPHDLPLPKGGTVTLAIAAVDEAGNTSAPKRLSVALRSEP